jgi:hypothetical protein
VEDWILPLASNGGKHAELAKEGDCCYSPLPFGICAGRCFCKIEHAGRMGNMIAAAIKIATTILLLTQVGQISPVSPASPSAAEAQQPAKKEDEEIAKIFPGGVVCDFGMVPYGTRARHTFRIVNTSNVPLRILEARVSMSPMRIWVSKSVLQPNEEGELEILLDTRKFTGNKRIAVYVTLDNGRLTTVRLTVSACSCNDVVVSDELDFATVQQGATPTKEVTTTLVGDSTFRVLKAKCDNNWILVNCTELVRGATETIYQIRATVRADIRAGMWTTDVELSTNHPAMPRIVVPVRVEVEPLSSPVPPASGPAW